jgi:cohesin complex subunit SA-1/2
MHVRHGAVLLAHYGRLGSTFDECAKVMVDVLREEGMGNGNPDVVVSIVTQAIREVCSSLFPTILRSHFSLLVVYAGA